MNTFNGEAIPVTEADGAPPAPAAPGQPNWQALCYRVAELERQMIRLRRWVLAIVLASELAKHISHDMLRQAVAVLIGGG